MGEVAPEVVWCSGDLMYELLTTVDERDDVVQVPAAKVIALAAPVERLELRRDQVGR